MRWKPHVRFGERTGETDQQETLTPRPGPTQPVDHTPVQKLRANEECDGTNEPYGDPTRLGYLGTDRRTTARPRTKLRTPRVTSTC